MADGPTKNSPLFHPKPREDRRARDATQTIALSVSLIWLIGVVGFFVVLPSGETGDNRLRSVMVLLAIVLPLAMIWIAAFLARALFHMQEDNDRVHASLEALRQTLLAERQARSGAGETSVARKMTEIARAAHKTDAALATFATTRPALGSNPTNPSPPDAPKAPPPEQPKLALGTTADDIAPVLSKSDLVRALNFPNTEADEAGFAALRRALKDRNAKQLIQASQDVLTLLSQDGIYMDDLQPDRAHPDIWRRFALGERGKSVAALGGIRDRSCLALTAARMREDGVFRDTAHHFLRRYDQMLASFEGEASDADLAALADTRTSRAFMLLGRVTGAFD